MSTLGTPSPFSCTWKALLPERNGNQLINLAGLKLMGMDPFLVKSVNHVFAVLSQRLCLDSVIANAEAVKLAEHMGTFMLHASHAASYWMFGYKSSILHALPI